MLQYGLIRSTRKFPHANWQHPFTSGWDRPVKRPGSMLIELKVLPSIFASISFSSPAFIPSSKVDIYVQISLASDYFY